MCPVKGNHIVLSESTQMTHTDLGIFCHALYQILFCCVRLNRQSLQRCLIGFKSGHSRTLTESTLNYSWFVSSVCLMNLLPSLRSSLNHVFFKDISFYPVPVSENHHPSPAESYCADDKQCLGSSKHDAWS